MSAIGSSISAGASIFNTKATNEANKETTMMTNNLNKQIADQNLALQREQFEYQKSLNDTQMQREDTAIQRMVADSRNAGVSPLANVQGSSSSPLASAPAPQSNMHYEGYNHQSADLSALQGIGEILNNVQQFKSQALDNQRKQIENEYQAQTLSSRVDNVKIENIFKRYNALDAREKRYYNNYFHINDNMSEEEKKIRILNTLIKNTGPDRKPTMTGRAQREELENPDFDFNDFTHFGYFDNDNLQNLSDTADAVTGFLSSKIEGYYDKAKDILSGGTFPEQKLKRIEELERKSFKYHGNLSEAEKAEYSKLKKEHFEFLKKSKDSKPKDSFRKKLWDKAGSLLF